MKFECTGVYNIYNAILGARNPKESWDRSDSVFYGFKGMIENTVIGEKDLKFLQGLIRAGSEHRKFMRQIFVSVDITAPQYFFAELDTYKVGTVRDSTSMQHKGVSHRYTIDDFEVDEEIKEVLRIKEKKTEPLFYPYESDEYKIYTCENGREYKVFKNGRLFSCAYDLVDSTGRCRHFDEREIIPSLTRSGYYEVNIGGGNGERWLIHRLVAECWLDNPEQLKTVDHKDGNKSNNSVENLEWVSLEENIKREWDNHKGFDLQKCYKNWKSSSKVNPIERLKIQELYQKGISQTEIANMYELKQAQISVICRNEKSTSENKELFEHCWYWEKLLEDLNMLRDKYLDTKDYKYFKLIRQLMPMGYLYKSTVTMNYENLLNICSVGQRRYHKLTEWSENFMKWAKTLPYAEELIFLDMKDESKVSVDKEYLEKLKGYENLIENLKAEGFGSVFQIKSFINCNRDKLESFLSSDAV